jgi:hypothetical protein
MSDHYILNDRGDPVKENDLEKWARWWQDADRIVWVTMVEEVKVSTVFLGVDHSFSPDESDPPMLYETMVFSWEDFPLEQDCQRSSTVDDALQVHIKMIELVKEVLDGGKG